MSSPAKCGTSPWNSLLAMLQLPRCTTSFGQNTNNLKKKKILIIYTDLVSNSKTPFSRPISESCRCLSRFSSFIWATQVFPISHSGRRHIVCQYLKDGREWVLSDQMANNQPGSKFCQYLIRVQVTSQGGGTFVSPPQVLPIWTIFNAATFTHRGKQGQTAVWRETAVEFLN